MVMLTGLVDAVSAARRRDAEAFAARLEGSRGQLASDVSPDVESLAVLARALVPAQVSPSPEFRSSLRDRLVAEAAARTPATPATPAVPAQRAGEPARDRAPRWRSAVAGLALASVVAGAGAAAASSSALPGDALYGLKLRIESVQLSLADSDLERGRELLEQADTRLGEAERLAASSSAGEPGTRRDLAATLTEMERATTAGADALTASYRESGDEEPMLLLDRFVTDQQERLRDLLGLVDPSLRARLLADAAVLGELGRGASAVLTPSSVGRISAVVGDGWTAARLADRTSGRLVSSGTSGTGTSGGSDSGGSGASVDGDVPAATSVTDVVDGVVSAGSNDTAGSTPSTGTGSTGSGTGVVPGVGGDVGAGTSGAAVPTPPAPPAPTVSVPAPLPSALPTALPTLPEAPTPRVSLPEVPVCVPVPPLSSC